ncbi:MAG TPA: hypothetical protein PKL78_02355 [Anaerolineales bacterium]|nr:hypothetical protein [Anaerolineales bacterium]HNN12371.1 hypothetical protein [Anaerolineales bacterium]
MNITANHKDLFKIPAPADKLALFRSLYEASQVDKDLALALLKVIHQELGLEQTRDRSVYKHYAEVIQSLNYQKTEMLQSIVEAWAAGRITKKSDEPEWLADGLIK